MSRRRAVLMLVPMLATFSPAAAQTSAEFIAGTQPDRRPQNAPQVSQVQRDAAWRDKTRRGIEHPYPPSLKFIENHGNWYTPFDRPGMPGPYDIRRLHRN